MKKPEVEQLAHLSESGVERGSESPEQERIKTPEERRQENIERMTGEARDFINEKKSARKQEEIKKDLENRPEEPVREDLEKEDRSEKGELDEVPAVEKKRGLVRRFQDYFLIRDLKKAGVGDPEKALEFYEYLRKIKPDFTLRSRYHMGIIKNSLEATGDPVAFYEKLKEVCEVKSYINPSDNIDSSGRLMSDPKYAEKIDMFKSVIEAFGKGRERIYMHEVADFCQDEKTIAELSPENLDRVKEILTLSGYKGNIRELPAILDVVQDEEVYRVISEMARGRRENDVVYVTTVAEKVRALRENDILKKVLAGIDLNLNISNTVNEIIYDGEKSVELEGLEMEKLGADEGFKQFSDDFSVLAGKKFNLKELKSLQNLYQYNGEHALAYFEVLKNFGILESDKEGDFDINKISDVIGLWKNRTATAPEVFYVMLDSDFQEKVKWLQGVGRSVKSDDIFHFAYIYVQNPEFLAALQTPEGKELAEFLNAREINPFDQQNLFKHPGLINTFRALDKHFIIEKNYVLDDYIDLHRKNLASSLVEFLDKAGISEEKSSKFTPGNVYYLLRIQKNSEAFDQELMKKYFDFYSSRNVLDMVEKNPAIAKEIDSLAEDGFLDNWKTRNMIYANLEKMILIPREKRKKYLEVIEKIDNSPSQEMQRIKNEIINQIIDTPNPEEAYQKIEDIFIKNNLPLVGKAFKIFAILHPAADIEQRLSQGNLSPCLTEAKTRKRYFTIYKDLINIHIKSGNRSLRDYLTIFKENEDLFEKIDGSGFESLDDQEKKRAEFVLKKVKTLFENSQKGRNMKPEDMKLKGDLEENYGNLKAELGVGEDQKVTDRISQMFLRPAGLENIDEALEIMREAKLSAHERGLSLVGGGKLDIKEGDLLKGVNHNFIDNILQNGSVAVEFLGADSGNDSTPLDTDLSMVLKEDAANGFNGAIDKSIATGYGSLLFCMKDRGQYDLTTKENVRDHDQSKLELFHTGVLGDRHYGIRTGFPTTEIDFMIAKDDLRSNQKKMEGIFLEIAQNGWYIPIADTNGNVIFTPDMYGEYRKAFDGLDRFEGSAVEFVPTQAGDKSYKDVTRMMQELPQDEERVTEINSKIRTAINSVLERNGVKLKEEFDTSIIGAELMDTGSTARHTNAPSNYDFDLILRLDNSDMGKVPQIVQELKAVFQAQGDESHEDNDGGYQLRAMGAIGIDGNPMDIDVGFVKKSELVQYGSHDAVNDKLNWIKGHVGQEAYEQTIANVILTKKILKEGEAYKKLEHGGIGGIGVENWILGNGGNISRAFETFNAAAHDENGNVVSFEEFKKKYKIIDPGINMKFNSHDNFSEIMKENGYQAMVKTVEKYLRK